MNRNSDQQKCIISFQTFFGNFIPDNLIRGVTCVYTMCVHVGYCIFIGKKVEKVKNYTHFTRIYDIGRYPLGKRKCTKNRTFIETDTGLT